MLPSRSMNDSSWVVKLQEGWQQFGKKYFWKVSVWLGFCIIILFSLMWTQDWVETSESSDLNIVLIIFWLVEFRIIIRSQKLGCVEEVTGNSNSL